MEPIRLIVAGSRQLVAVKPIYKVLDEYLAQAEAPVEIVTGMAEGPDKIAYGYANMNNIPVHCFPAEWRKHGMGAGYIRNAQMGDIATALIALWDGQSRGTKHMINYMRKLKKPTYVFYPQRIGDPSNESA